MLLVEVADEPRVQLLGIEPALLPELLGSLFELRKVVHPALDEITHLLRREQRLVGARRLLAVEARRELLARPPLRLVGRVEGHHRPGHLGVVEGQVPQVGRRELVGVEEGVREDLEEVVDEPRVVVAVERVKVGPEELNQLDEERRGQRAPVRLDEVQVARRDPEALGELHLAQALAAAKGSNLGAESGSFPCSLSHEDHLSRPAAAGSLDCPSWERWKRVSPCSTRRAGDPMHGPPLEGAAPRSTLYRL